MKCLHYFRITSMKEDTSAPFSGRGELNGRLGLLPWLFSKMHFYASKEW